MLLLGLTGIALSLAVISVVLGYSHASLLVAWLVLACMMFFVACQALSTGPACWLIPSEIFPAKMRGFGMGVSVAFNWGTNVVVGLLFPSMLLVSTKFAFGTFLVIALFAIFYVYRFLPETKTGL